MTYFKLIAFNFVVVIIILFTTHSKADSLSCLAEAVYFEARSESFVAQLAVANVVLQRVQSERYPDKICDVVRQGRTWKGNPVKNKCHFSYWCDGKPETIANVVAYAEAVNVARLAMKGVVLILTEGATHYHASYVLPYWALDERFSILGQIDNHVFYIDNTN
jgi:spore germination cell wall hydrolase CwlJ-like protein